MARGLPDPADRRAQLLALGLPDQLAPPREEIEVPADALPAIELLQACATPWRWLAVGERAIPTGLDYTAVRATAAWLGLGDDPAVLHDLRWLEAGALEALSAAADEAAP